MKDHRRNPVKTWGIRSPAARPALRVEPGLALVFILLLAVAIGEDSPSTVTLKAMQAQELVDELRVELSIDYEVQLAVVIRHPLVFSVERADNRDRFRLSVELGFLLMLDDDELRAALAHELGHVWIFTNHPFLQTERLANQIGQRVVDRKSFERLYSKLWAYEGASGVPMEQLLGPLPESNAGPLSDSQNRRANDGPL